MWRWVLACTDPTADGPPGPTSDDTSTPPPQGYTARLLPEGQANLLLPIHVGLDVTGRRLYVSSNGLPNIAEIDVDAAELVAVHTVDTVNLHPRVAAGAAGVWLGYEDPPALMRLTGEVVEAGVERVHALVSTDDGGAVLAGSAGEADLLVSVDASGAVVSSAVDGSVLALDVGAGGVAALVREGDATAPTALISLDADLAVSSRCDIVGGGQAAFSWMDESPQGWVVSMPTGVATLTCPSGAWTEIPIGRENRAIFSLPDETILVLDRLGAADRNWGVARRFDASLAAIGKGTDIGKNSGYAAYDPTSGLVWMNSEGTGEVWAVDGATGAIVERIRLGAHVESLVADADGRVVFTGRLAAQYGRADAAAEELTVAEGDLTWPSAPTWLGERLFVLDELDTTVAEIDPDTLEVMSERDPGLGSNAVLTLSDMVAHPTRGTLFVTHGELNVLAEIDPDEMVVLNRWDLGGGVVTDPNVPGRLEALVVPDGVLTLRNHDGAWTLVDPDASEPLASGTLDDEAIRAVSAGHQLDAARLSRDGERVWVAGAAFDTRSLTGVRSLEGVDLVIDDDGGEVVAWRADPPALFTISASDERSQPVPVESAAWGHPAAVLVGEGQARAVWLGSFDGATLHFVPLPG